MLSTQGYAAMTAKAALQSFVSERRDVGPHDVLIAISNCGTCHSDLHQARDEWGGSISPWCQAMKSSASWRELGPRLKNSRQTTTLASLK